jgi:hypothetical protein
MSRYQFELATPAEDADLRHIMAATPMDGSIVVSFRREPSYFDAAVVEGRFRQIVAARDTQTGRVVGFGSRSISTKFINGVPTPIGYLSNLRLLPEHRSLGLIARGYRYFRELHEDGRTKLYLTTIAAQNRKALDLLTSGRAGLPHYQPAGDFHTFAIPTGARWSHPLPPEGIEVREATAEDGPWILEVVKSQGRRRQFFPEYQLQDFADDQGLLRGIGLSDLRLAMDGHDIVGMAAIWNQQRFRQTVIDSYRGTLRYGRGLLDLAAKLLDRPRLPHPGSQIRAVNVALPLVSRDDPEVFAALISRLLRDVSHQEADYLLIGIHESDPLLPVVRSFRGRCYTTRLFLVTWDDGSDLAGSLDGRPLYLELGAL